MRIDTRTVRNTVDFVATLATHRKETLAALGRRYFGKPG